MSFFVGGAIVTGAVVSGVSADRAADKQAKGVKKGLEQSAALAEQARRDVMGLFDLSAKNQGIGTKAALDYYKTAVPRRIQPYIQGNQQAQQVIGQGAVQSNNAILGLPVDMGFTQQSQAPVDTSYLNGGLIPQYESYAPAVPQDSPQPVARRGGGSGGLLGSVGKRLSKIF